MVWRDEKGRLKDDEEARDEDCRRVINKHSEQMAPRCLGVGLKGLRIDHCVCYKDIVLDQEEVEEALSRGKSLLFSLQSYYAESMGRSGGMRGDRNNACELCLYKAYMARLASFGS